MEDKNKMLEAGKQTLAEQRKVTSNHLQETELTRNNPFCPEESSEIGGRIMYLRKQKKVVKTEELVENLWKEQLDS